MKKSLMSTLKTPTAVDQANQGHQALEGQMQMRTDQLRL
jgi:hypothetical protein